MIIDEEAAKQILHRIDGVEADVAKLKAKQAADHVSLVARQRRQEDVSAEHHEDIRTILASLEATSAAVTVLMHEKYKVKK